MTRSQMAFILAERDGEDRIAVVNQEPQFAEAVPQVHG